MRSSSSSTSGDAPTAGGLGRGAVRLPPLRRRPDADALGLARPRAAGGVPPGQPRAVRGGPARRRDLPAGAVPLHHRPPPLVATQTLREEVIGLLQELIRLEHRQPARERDARRPSCCAATWSRSASSASCTRACRSGRTSWRGSAGAATGRGCCSSRTRTRCSPIRPSGRSTRGRASFATAQVWGRGALDMKGQVAASAVAIASLAREGFEPSGDLIFAATADEEVGDDPDFGLSWLCREHPDAVRCEYAVNEGAGDRVEVAGRPFYLCAIGREAELAVRPARHRPQRSRVAALDRGQRARQGRGLIERVAALEPEPRLIPEVEAFLAAIGCAGSGGRRRARGGAGGRPGGGRDDRAAARA